jgi:putative endonuclease
VEDRLKKHLTNHAGFTAHAKDWEIVFREEFSTSKEARNRELQIKGWRSRTLIEKLLKSKA